jgi:DNA polymerase elongation subunit (family B)
MTIYKTLSRNIPNLDEVIRVIKRRLEYKEINDKRQLPLKRALNSLYGKSKDKTSSAYDPRQANRTCIYGQLFLLDLIEMIEDRITLINTNTDGLIFKVESIKDLEELKKICKIWEDRTRFKLGYKIYSKIIQKDVNNYILIKNKNEYDIVNTTDKVDIKSKGTYVKKLNDLDNDLPVVNKAVVDFFVKDIPVEFTILECNELIQFQQICKVSNKYICAMHNNKRLKERIFRTYAVNSDGHTLFKLKELIREEDQFHTIFKTTDSNINMIDLAEQMDVIAMEIKKNNKGKYVKISPQYAQKRYIDYINGYRIEKVQNTPINCIIYNDDVRNKQIFNNLDKDWYIALAKTRIHDFIIGKNKKKVVDVNAT